MPTTRRSTSRSSKSGSRSRSTSRSRSRATKSSSKSSGRASRSTSSRTRTSHSKSSSGPKSSISGRKYSPKAGQYVEEEMHEMKQGKLKSGRSGKTVRNPKQAVAIGLSKARKAGAKVPSKKAA